MLVTSSATITPPQSQPFRGLAVWLLAVNLVIGYSRFFDVIASGYHIPGVLNILLIVATFLSGAFLRPFASPVGRCLLALTFWVTLSVPMGIWRSGSMPSFLTFLACVALFLAAAGLPVTFRHC